MPLTTTKNPCVIITNEQKQYCFQSRIILPETRIPNIHTEFMKIASDYYVVGGGRGNVLSCIIHAIIHGTIIIITIENADDDEKNLETKKLIFTKNICA